MLDAALHAAQARPFTLHGLNVGPPFEDNTLYVAWGEAFSLQQPYSTQLRVRWSDWLQTEQETHSLRRQLFMSRDARLRSIVRDVGSSCTLESEGPLPPDELAERARHWYEPLLPWIADEPALQDALAANASSRAVGAQRWAYESKPSWSLRGELLPEHEEPFVQRLLQLGARVRPNVMDGPVPDHRHRTGRQFGVGEAFHIDADWGELSYVPHDNSSYELRERAVTTITLAPEALRRRALADGETPIIYRETAVRVGGIIVQSDDPGYEPPSVAEMRLAGYVPYESGWVKRADWPRATVRAKAQAWDETEPLRVTLDGPLDADRSETTARRLQEAALRAGWPRVLTGIELLRDVELSVDVERSYERGRRAHNAPPSERGVFRVRHADPEAAFAWLREQIGLRAPVNRHRVGRLTPRLQAYATGSATPPRLPKDHLIVHGLTGADTRDQALARLQAIVESGGLYSLQERRRRGLTLPSLDQHGDTASSMDRGVPATITTSPWAGNHVFFVFQPEVLERRDVWFMNGCPGGTGAEQRAAYEAYARELGHTLHQPPPPAARERHLKSGLTQYNEFYLRHEVRLEDIAAVLVNRHGGFTRRVTAVLRANPQAAHIQVYDFASSGQGQQQGVLPGAYQSSDLGRIFKRLSVEQYELRATTPTPRFERADIAPPRKRYSTY
jgi:hypothetical protein